MVLYHFITTFLLMLAFLVGFPLILLGPPYLMFVLLPDYFIQFSIVWSFVMAALSLTVFVMIDGDW